MKCPHCFHKIPGFLVKAFLERKNMCPECTRYCPLGVAEDAQRAKNEELRRHAEADRQESYCPKF
jgi:hypothetical protein